MTASLIWQFIWLANRHWSWWLSTRHLTKSPLRSNRETTAHISFFFSVWEAVFKTASVPLHVERNLETEAARNVNLITYSNALRFDPCNFQWRANFQKNYILFMCAPCIETPYDESFAEHVFCSTFPIAKTRKIGCFQLKPCRCAVPSTKKVFWLSS
jgi:hypothetical protein